MPAISRPLLIVLIGAVVALVGFYATQGARNSADTSEVAAPVVPAELRASDKLDNQLGIVITRFAPVEGVLGYQRDKVLTLGKGD